MRTESVSQRGLDLSVGCLLLFLLVGCGGPGSSTSSSPAAGSNLPASYEVSYLIMVGVVSGVLSAVIVWLFSTFRNEAILPWYQRLVYRGVLVDGAWKGERKDNNTVYGFDLHLKQDGHAITGTFTAENQRGEGTHTTKSFRLDGEITDSCVLLRYSPSDQHTYGSGAFLFQVFEAGRVLKGGMLYFQTRSGQIGSVNDLRLERTA